MATRNSLADSSIPNQRITSGIKAKAGILRIICKVVSSRVEAVLDEPLSRPKISPRPPPTNNPLRARPALTLTCVHSSPLSSKFQNAMTTALGAGKMWLSSKPVLDAICQSRINPTGTNQGSKRCPSCVPRETFFLRGFQLKRLSTLSWLLNTLSLLVLIWV